MRKQYWTIIQPDGKLLFNEWWERKFGRDGAWHVVYMSEHEDVRSLAKKGWKVVKIWVEIEGE